jgi:hypothetical protein
MKRFVPITDELIYDHPERITAPLVPFSLDYQCHRGLAERLPDPPIVSAAAPPGWLGRRRRRRRAD